MIWRDLALRTVSIGYLSTIGFHGWGKLYLILR